MFYFFRRDEEYIRCEIRGAMDSLDEYELVIVEPSGTERVERHPSSTAVHNRWLEVLQSFVHDGWWGPLGRE
jgi:hypothetical protein